jgi:O-antigen/teichoic acid export membrane protein
VNPRTLIRLSWNSAVLWSWLNTLIRMGSSVIILSLAARLIPRDEFGLWYVFLALGSMSGLLELGFRNVVSINASYLWAGASSLKPIGLPALHDSPSPHPARIASFVATFARFYQGIAAMILAFLWTIGFAWIAHQTQSFEHRVSLRLAWLVYALAFAVNFSGGFWAALLSGIDRIRAAQHSQTQAALAGLALTATGLLLGWGVWGLVMGHALTGWLTRSLVRRRFLDAVPNLTLRGQCFDASFIRTLWPMAWRTSVGGIGVFLLAQANTLICSAYLDLRTTASYGLSMQLAGTLAGVSAIWVQAKLPALTQLRLAAGNEVIAVVFARRIILFVGTFLFGALALLVFGDRALALVASQTPLLPRALFAAMLLVMFLEVHHSLYAALVLTENRNPFVLPGIFSGLTSALLSAVLTRAFGAVGLIAAPGIVQAAFNNWWCVWRGIRGMDLSVRQYLRILLRSWMDLAKFRASA